MGLFDDDFYSTKVPRREGRGQEPSKVLTSRNWSARKSRRSLATWQVSVISSVISAVVAVLLFSLATGQLTQEKAEQPKVIEKVTASSGDPYERIVQAAALVR